MPKSRGRSKSSKKAKKKDKIRDPSGSGRSGRLPRISIDELFNLLSNVPAELRPVYTIIGLATFHAAGQPAQTCVARSCQIAYALDDFGYSADVVTVQVQVDNGAGRVTRIGTTDRPSLSADGTWNGHAVAYCADLSRVIDVTIAQDPQVARKAAELGRAVVMPLPSPDLLFTAAPAVQRGGLTIAYHANPSHIGTWREWLTGDRETQLRAAARAVSLDAVDLMRVLENDGMAPVPWPRVRRLIDGVDRLQEPPPGKLYIR